MEKNLKLIRLQTLALLAAVLVAFPAVSMAKGKISFSAKLSGAAEVPTVTTSASGRAVFSADVKTEKIRYMVRVKDIEDVTMAHIHLGAKGKNGPPIAMLHVRSMKKGKFSGVLARGIITKKDLMGPYKGKTVKDLVREMETGNTYVNVHTKAHPEGEIRGQISKRK